MIPAPHRAEELMSALLPGDRARELSEQFQLERQLRQAAREVEDLYENAPCAYYSLDEQGRFLRINQRARDWLGCTREEVIGKLGPADFLSPETLQVFRQFFPVLLATGRVDGIEAEYVSRSGVRRWVTVNATVLRDEQGGFLSTRTALFDITARKQAEQELAALCAQMEYRATHDDLTGLVNRAEFELRTSRLFAEVQSGSRRRHAVMLIDLDQFKLVNDTCGHAVGDQLLRQVGTLLQDAVRAGDTVARLGGDEFGLILQDCTASKADRVGRKICTQMEAYRFVHEEHRFRIGTSIGLVEMDPHWASAAAMQQAADSACFRAKDEGRNRIHRVHPTDDLVQLRQDEIHWINRLEQAMDDNEFVLYGQRIAGLGTPTHGLCLEVLLRLQDAQGVAVPPAAFMPAAERYHLAPRLDRWVVRRAFAKLQALGPHLDAIEMISINLSGRSVGDRIFHRQLLQMVREARFDVRKVCFEITETAAISNFVDARPFVEELRRLGVRVALDDFGAGASSFTYLKSLPVDYLKIDGQFITHLLEDPLDHAAVQCFHQVAQAIGVRTVAEFVEREDVRTRLREIGIDFVQGYLIHRPEPLKTLLARARATLETPPANMPQT